MRLLVNLAYFVLAVAAGAFAGILISMLLVIF